MEIVSDVAPLIKTLEYVIRNTFIPAIVNDRQPSDQQRRLLQLLPRMGGLTNPQNLPAEFGTYSE